MKGSKTGGRTKGVPNKISADVRDMILGALEAAGGQRYLVQQAKKNPAAFLTLVGKMLPKEVAAAIEHRHSDLADLMDQIDGAGIGLPRPLRNSERIS